MAFIFASTYFGDLWQALNDFILEPAQEDIRQEVNHWNALVDPWTMVLQKISETSQSVKFNVWFDSAVPLPDRRFYFFINEFDYILNMWLKIFVISAYWQPTEWNEALTSIFAFSFVNVLFDLIDDLSEPTLVFVIAGDESIHRGNQIDTFLFYQSTFGLTQHSLDFVDNSLTLVFSIFVFTTDDLLARTVLRN